MEMLIPPIRKYGTRFHGIHPMMRFIRKLGPELELQFYLYYFQVYDLLYRDGYFSDQNYETWDGQNGHNMPLTQTIQSGITQLSDLLQQYRQDPTNFQPPQDWWHILPTLHTYFDRRIYSGLKHISEELPLFKKVTALSKDSNAQHAFYYNLPVVVYYNFCQKHGLCW